MTSSYWGGGETVPSPLTSYSEYSSSYSPGSVSSVMSSSVYSPDSSSVFSKNGDSVGGSPYLEIIEQTAPQFRFRYKSEMQGTHGAIQGVKSTKKNKTFPSVRLHNYNGSAIIRCTLFTADKKSLHVHRLVGKSSGKEKEDPHDICVGTHTPNGYSACFQNLVIIHVAKKHLVEELVQKKKRVFLANYPHSLESAINFDILAKFEKEAEQETKKMDMNCAVLRFEALTFENDHYAPLPHCKPVFSHSIKNLKCHVHGQLKICRMDRVSGSCEGDDEIFLLVEKVGKDNIKVIMTESDEYGKEVWSDYCKFTTADVHHQFAIVCRTPKYRFCDINEKVSVDIQLERITDGARSEPREFTYTPRENYHYQLTENNKRKRVASSAPLQAIVTNSVERFPSPHQQFDISSTTTTTLELSVQTQTLQQPNVHLGNLGVVGYPFVDATGENNIEKNPLWPPPSEELTNHDNIYAPIAMVVTGRNDTGIDVDVDLMSATERSTSITQLLNTLPTPDESQMTDYFNPGVVRKIIPLVADQQTDVGLLNDYPPNTDWLVFDGGDKKTMTTNCKIISNEFCDRIGVCSSVAGESSPTVLMSDLASVVMGKLNNLLNDMKTKNDNRPDDVHHMMHKKNNNGDGDDENLLHLNIDNVLLTTTTDGYSALHGAVIHKQVSELNSLVAFLKQHNRTEQHINRQSVTHQTPLHLAVSNGCSKIDVEIVNVLLDGGADPSKVDLFGRTPLHVAVKSNFEEAIMPLLESPLIEIDAVSDNDGTALHIAAERNKVDLAKILIEYGGADINCINKKTGRTPLHIAVINKNTEIVDLFLQQDDVQIDKEDFNGFSPLKLISGECQPWMKICKQLAMKNNATPITGVNSECIYDESYKKKNKNCDVLMGNCDDVINQLLLPKFFELVINGDCDSRTDN